jgi:DNA-nicking Smr family endonuclease
MADEDDQDWAHALTGVRPLKGQADGTAKAVPARKPLHVRLRPREPDILAQLPRRAPDSSAKQLDKNTLSRLKRGKMTVERRLDLHGYTLDAAYATLRAFIVQAAGDGMRCVLVVTGKGDPLATPVPGQRPRGAIRREFPHWLMRDPLCHLVLRAVPAQVSDGGVGAFYVYLRRAREKS